MVLYKPLLEDFERKNICLMFNYLHEYKWYIVAPENIDVELPYDDRIEREFICLNARFFKSIGGYNKLLLSSDFYRRFENLSEYLLIVQPDVTIIRKFNEDLLDKDIIYYGARWGEPLQLYPIFGRKFSGLFNISL